MFQNFELEIFLIILLLLIIISMIPLIELKYKSDLYDKIETFNKYCLNNDIHLINELETKDTYMWNISYYIYDIENLNNFFYKNNDNNYIIEKNDYIGLDRTRNKVTVGNNYIDNIMKIYNNYLYMSIGLFIFLIGFLISQILIAVFINKFDDLKACLTSGDNNYTFEETFRYYIYALFLYILLFIIFFSIILKKLTELYADTDTYEYIMLMKELNILLKEDNPTNSAITNILKKYSKNKINDISYSPINNSELIKDLLNVYNKNNLFKYNNSNNYTITLKNIDKLEYYNSDESKNKVKNKINDIFRFIYIYILFIIIPIYLLSISLQGNYIYLLFSIITVIIFSIYIYNIYNTLHD
jgi:hypothetical protein